MQIMESVKQQWLYFPNVITTQLWHTNSSIQHSFILKYILWIANIKFQIILLEIWPVNFYRLFKSSFINSYNINLLASLSFNPGLLCYLSIHYLLMSLYFNMYLFFCRLSSYIGNTLFKRTTRLSWNCTSQKTKRI